MSKIRFKNEFVPDQKSIKSILDYSITFNALNDLDTHYEALGMNYSVTGFELILTRKMSFYVVTYYLPSGLFVVVSWIRYQFVFTKFGISLRKIWLLWQLKV